MKVVLVNHSDSLGGASVVTYRLMEALIAQGVDARMLVVKKSTGSPYVAEAAGRFAAGWRSLPNICAYSCVTASTVRHCSRYLRPLTAFRYTGIRG